MSVTEQNGAGASLEGISREQAAALAMQLMGPPAGAPIDQRPPRQPLPRTPGKRIESDAIATAPYRPTISLDPRNIAGMKECDAQTAPLFAHLTSAFTTAFNGLEAIANARMMALENPAWPDARKILEVSKLAESRQLAMTKAIDHARTDLEAKIKHFEGVLYVPIKQAKDADTAISSEVRRHFKELPDEQRMQALGKAFAEKDHVVLTSVLAGPAILSGLSTEMHGIRVREYQELSNPTVNKQLRAVRAAADMLDARGGLIFAEVEKAMGAKWEKVQKLRKANSAAEAALIASDLK